MKPDWKDAPEWANYLAKESDGSWFWYELRPEINTSLNIWESFGCFEIAAPSLPIWKNSLEQRP